MLIPNVKRTWAPKGKTPHISHWFKQDRISAISAISVSPKRRHLSVYFRFRKRNIISRHVIQFLRHLGKHLQGHIFLIWDGSPTHKSKSVVTFLSRHPRIHVERFPAYAPELNPVEYLWSQTDAALSNGAPENISILSVKLRKELTRIRYSQQLLWGCIHGSELSLSKL